MTREEAIAVLKGAIKKPNTKDGYLGQAIDMAIKALQEPILDKVKQAREDIENLTPWDEGTVEMHEVLEIIDKLIAENEVEK